MFFHPFWSFKSWSSIFCWWLVTRSRTWMYTPLVTGTMVIGAIAYHISLFTLVLYQLQPQVHIQVLQSQIRFFSAWGARICGRGLVPSNFQRAETVLTCVVARVRIQLNCWRTAGRDAKHDENIWKILENPWKSIIYRAGWPTITNNTTIIVSREIEKERSSKSVGV